MTIKKFFWLKPCLLWLFALLLMTGCGSSKDIAYLENPETLKQDAPTQLYDARIMPKDMLTITVNTLNPTASAPFNLIIPVTSSQPSLQSYLVENDGYINFPVIGRIKVSGLTKKETEEMIAEKVKPYMTETENPIVTVRMSSFSISVVGEVNSPGNFFVSREKINVLEALARAGDMTIYGVRDKVKLIRENAEGHKEIYTLNLNDVNLVNSPYYYMQQNDILYVEPNKVKAQNSNIGNMTTIWVSTTGILISVATLLISIFK